MISPYPLGFTVSLPWYYLRPGRRNRCGLEPSPLRGGTAPTGETLRLVFGGDVMASSRWRPVQVHEELARVTRRADLLVLNCEGPVVDRARWQRRLIRERLTKGWFEALLEQLVTTPRRCVLGVANNHAGDWGPHGLRETLRILDRLGVLPIGQHDPGSGPITTVALRGLQVGFAAWTRWMNRPVFGPGGGVWRRSEVAGIPWRELRNESGLDLLVATPHWEFEFRHFPVPATRWEAADLVEEGFDLVVGHHPHVAQPLERLGSSLCLYSAGGLTGPAIPVPWPARLGLLLEVEIDTRTPQPARAMAYQIHPFAQCDDGDRIALVPLHHAPPALARRLGERLGLMFAT